MVKDMIPTLGSRKKILSGPTNKSNRHRRMQYMMIEQLNNSHNRINMRFVGLAQILLLLPRV